MNKTGKLAAVHLIRTNMISIEFRQDIL